MLACAEGDVCSARMIVEDGGARISAQVGTKVLASSAPLHVAARYGHTAVVSALLELGATTDIRDSQGLQPLHFAAGNGHVQTIQALLDAGADASAEGPGGATALDMAEMAGFSEAAAVLHKETRGLTQMLERRRALAAWLEVVGGEAYLPRFLRAGYDDLEFLASHGLVDEDLDCIGVPRQKLGLRKKLLALYKADSFLPPTSTRGGSISVGERASTATASRKSKAKDVASSNSSDSESSSDNEESSDSEDDDSA